MHSVSAIIPTYNEAGRIRRVLGVLRQLPELHEILVVDDGSTDATREDVLKEAEADGRIHLLRMPANRGKGQAVLAGVRALSADLILMLDGDLIDLEPDNVRALIAPVACGRADMTLGLFQGGRFWTDFAHWATPWLTGQRCLRRELFRYLTDQNARGYGLETALTMATQVHNYRVERVPLRGVWHPSSEFHRGAGRAVIVRVRMHAQIWHAWYLHGGPEVLRMGLRRRIRRLWQDPLRAWRKARKRVQRFPE
jgi:glycosyltransferase involved in cell wall biosynthesis